MKPIEFKEQNATFVLPADNEGKTARKLPAYKSDDGHIVSCWRMNLKDRLKALFTGRVWLGLNANSQPPVLLTTRYPFVRCPRWAIPGTIEVDTNGDVCAICKKTGCLAVVYKAKKRKES
ncbi:MAG: hypothetical protein ACM3S4_04755 [Burkholderiales bacterium]